MILNRGLCDGHHIEDLEFGKVAFVLARVNIMGSLSRFVKKRTTVSA